MTSLRRYFIFLLLGFVLGSANAQFAASYAPIAADVRLERDLLDLTNAERRRMGLSTLLPDEALALAARHHAQEMVSLNYFSHSSPTPRNATLSQRVAQAGSAAIGVGENLALVGPQEVAQRSVQGWMESPGHRENLLRPDYTHVGFGTARDASGRVFVAQVFAVQPLEVDYVQVTSRLQESYLVEVEVTLSETQEVALFYGAASLPSQVLEAGSHVLSFSTPDAAQFQLRVGVREPGAAGGFIQHDDGWLSADGRWRSSGSAPRSLATIDRVSRRFRVSRVYRAELTLAVTPQNALGVWLAGEYTEPEIRGRTLSVSIPSTLDAPTLDLGEQMPNGRYALLYRLQLNVQSGVPRLAPATPN